MTSKNDDEGHKAEFLKYTLLITEAHNLISVAETRLCLKYSDLTRAIGSLEEQLSAKCTRTKIQQVEQIQQVEHVINKSELSNKQLFKKIAQITHPDKANRADLFIKAKRALRDNNRQLLNDLFSEASSDYRDLMLKKQGEYEALINSKRYVIANWFLNGSDEQRLLAERDFFETLVTTLSIKTSMLNTL